MCKTAARQETVLIILMDISKSIRNVPRGEADPVLDMGKWKSNYFEMAEIRPGNTDKSPAKGRQEDATIIKTVNS